MENLADDSAYDSPPASTVETGQPKGMYPSSAGESEGMIAERRTAITDAQKRAADAQAEINQLTNEIAVLNSLRQANGLAPL